MAEDSFLRAADPRTKIALALAASAAVTLPLAPLVVVAACLASLLAVGRLARAAATQLWKARLWLLVLFLLDSLCIGVDFAVLITLRLVVLAAAFTIVFATTTTDELCLAGERLGLPPRLAFALAMAFRSLGLVEREWQEIREAQQARGIELPATRRAPRRWSVRREDLGNATALVVPAIVLAVQRAWTISEAAAARGFESPLRRPYRQLRLRRLDHALLAATAVVLAGSLLLR
jgi:energy-coupling factor transporter transmembrane protein EcfT